MTDRSQRSEDRSLAPTPVVGGGSQKFEEGLRTKIENDKGSKANYKEEQRKT